jgi:single-stranded-DNA-specific exonuclease
MPATPTICRRELPDGAHDLPADLHPVLRRIYAARRVTAAVELDHSLERLIAPSRMKGIAEATVLLAHALDAQRRILIVADFDADGATACALAVRALKAMGAAEVLYVVPNRFEYGYGLTPEIVALAARYSPDLLITVDNGISSVEGVRAAKDRGMHVLITDHHLPGAALPPADAIVNPNQPGDAFPSKCLAGVGVVFYLMLALRAHLRSRGYFARRTIPEPNLGRFLDLVALGTVADVVPLDHNNRILVAQGLARIRRGQCVPGIGALLRTAGRDPARVTAMNLGFFAAPRLNAAGRLTDMSHGIECLLADDPTTADVLARDLDRLNRERRAIEADMQAQAFAAVQNLRLENAALPRGVCLFDESWHQGVIGLVAARIKERVHRPVAAFAPAGEGMLKGSVRTVSGLHVRDALDNIAARYPGLLAKFGGHAMAAGLTLPRAQYDRFALAFDEEVGRWLSEADLEGRLLTDGELAPEDLTLALAERLRDAGPWGQEFPEPLFDGSFEVLDSRVVGERHLKLWLRHTGDTKTIEAIAFDAAPESAAPECKRVRAVYRLDVNEYQGSRSLQLVIEHLEPVELG